MLNRKTNEVESESLRRVLRDRRRIEENSTFRLDYLVEVRENVRTESSMPAIVVTAGGLMVVEIDSIETRLLNVWCQLAELVELVVRRVHVWVEQLVGELFRTKDWLVSVVRVFEFGLGGRSTLHVDGWWSARVVRLCIERQSRPIRSKFDPKNSNFWTKFREKNEADFFLAVFFDLLDNDAFLFECFRQTMNIFITLIYQ